MRVLYRLKNGSSFFMKLICYNFPNVWKDQLKYMDQKIDSSETVESGSPQAAFNASVKFSQIRFMPRRK